MSQLMHHPVSQQVSAGGQPTLLGTLRAAICVFSCAEHAIDLPRLQRTLTAGYADYQWDNYLLQQHKITLIREQLTDQQCAAVPRHLWHDLYHGKLADVDIPKMFPSLSSATFKQITALLPTRKRLMSEYDLEYRDGWHIERVPNQPQVMRRPLVADSTTQDFRVSERVFKALPESLCDADLRHMLAAAAERVQHIVPTVRRLHIVVHHTLIVCRPHQSTSNSPEGIHQDGKDFIVSALVVERGNVSGGKSIIYGADKSTRLFECELQAGQGIFHADAGTDLWHEVTPVVAIDADQPAFRSTIGLDVALLD